MTEGEIRYLSVSTHFALYAFCLNAEMSIFVLTRSQINFSHSELHSHEFSSVLTSKNACLDN